MGPKTTEVPEIHSDVVSMDADGRIVIPVEVRRSLTWLERQGKGPIVLLVDLYGPGHLRVYPADAIRSDLERLRQRLFNSHSDPIGALATLADRYREAKFYPSDSRLHCNQAITTHLRLGSGQTQQLYVESLVKYFDVMTLELRFARLARLQNDLNLSDDWMASRDAS